MPGVDSWHEFLLGENVIASRDHVSACAPQLCDELGRQPEATRRVLSVEDRDVGFELTLEPRQQSLDRFATGLADDVSNEENPEVIGHACKSLLPLPTRLAASRRVDLPTSGEGKQKGEPELGSP